MRLRVFTEPQQGASYDELLAVAQLSEALGFDAFFRSDHYMAIGEPPRRGRPGSTDAWMTLAAIARETTTIRLGTMVTPITFRHPGSLAIQVAQADAMSNGRVELGLGAGWYEAEHRAYALPFPPTRDRFQMLEEQLAILTGLWSTAEGETYSYSGRHYDIADSPALPKPTQRPRPPIIIGGWGTKTTPRLAAAYADEFNVPFPPVDYYRTACDHVRAACEQHGRDPDTMRFSVAAVVCVGATDAEFRARADAIGQDADQLRANAIAGTVGEAIERIRAFGAAGAELVYLQYLSLEDHDHLRLIANDVAPHT